MKTRYSIQALRVYRRLVGMAFLGRRRGGGGGRGHNLCSTPAARLASCSYAGSTVVERSPAAIARQHSRNELKLEDGETHSPLCTSTISVAAS